MEGKKGREVGDIFRTDARMDHEVDDEDIDLLLKLHKAKLINRLAVAVCIALHTTRTNKRERKSG